MAGYAPALCWGCKGSYSQGNLAGLAMQQQQHACPHGAGTLVSAAHKLGAARGGGCLPSGHHFLPPIFTASTAQPMDPGPPVLPPCLAGTRANVAFLRGLKEPQPYCAQALLKQVCPTGRTGPQDPQGPNRPRSLTLPGPLCLLALDAQERKM